MLNRVTGVLFIALGVLSMVDGWRVTEQARAEAHSGELPTLALALGLFAAFAFAVPYIGFSPACFLFLAALLWVLSGWAWWKAIAVAVPITLAFHVAFVTFADMPFPKGYFGI